MRTTGSLSALLAVAFVVAACGGSTGLGAPRDTEPEPTVDVPPAEGTDADTLAVEQPYVVAFATATSTNLGFAADDAQCVARAVIRELDLAALTTAGVTPEALAKADDLSAFDAFDAVEDGGEGRMAVSFKSCHLGELLAAATFVDTSSATARCLSASWGGTAPPLLAAQLVGGPDTVNGEDLLVALVGGLPGECGRSLLIDALLDDGAVTLAQSRCIEDKLPDDLVRRLLTFQVEQDPAGLRAELDPILAFCAA